MDEPVGADEYARRIRAFCGRPGGHPGLPRKRRDRLIVLHAAARPFADRPALPERELTEELHAWLEDVGRNMEMDAVSLRRALIDDGFLERDAAGTSYRPSGLHRRWILFEPEVNDLDVAGLVAAERALAEERRKVFREQSPI